MRTLPPPTRSSPESTPRTPFVSVLVGKTAKADDHRQAVGELRKAGKIGADLAFTLDRLLKPKTKSQYQTLSMVMKDAESAVNQATRLVEEASSVVGE